MRPLHFAFGAAVVLAVAAAKAQSAPSEPGIEVEVRGEPPRLPRGVGDSNVSRELLEASPRQHASELLSAAPGFFVDHEDAEGLGNDVTLRGFDLEHGAGIEMRVNSVPINSPVHIRGSGYADVDFVIPEVVESIQVVEGTYDPRQGDAAIVGSANFSLGVAERGTQLKASYGSFNQLRLLGITAPHQADGETFAAVALRKTDGFGENRQGRSGSVNAQYAIHLSRSARLRCFGVANITSSNQAGVVREDDVEAGRIGYLDSYPHFGQNQGVDAQRVLLGVELSRAARDGRRQRLLPFVTWTGLRARQNYTGALESSQIDPSIFGRGDLFETKNREIAAGALAWATIAQNLGSVAQIVVEAGASFRGGKTELEKNLLDPQTLERWDRRVLSTVVTLDTGAYLDAELRLWKRLRLAGGPRLDFLARSIEDRLRGTTELAAVASSRPGPGARRAAAGLALGPRVSAEYAFAPELSAVAAYGEGFRSLDPSRLFEGNTRPYSRVRSVELGLRARDRNARLKSSLAVFQTWVENELVFVAEAGGLETQNGSVRRGLVASLFFRPNAWLMTSSALSVTDAEFQTRVQGVSHNVPNVPPLLFRADVALQGVLGTWSDLPVQGRLGVGYTFAAAAHISDQLRGPSRHALAVGAHLRRRAIELGLDGYNLLDLRAADTTDRFISNWSSTPGQQPASAVVHTVAAPPRSLIASLSLYL